MESWNPEKVAETYRFSPGRNYALQTMHQSVKWIRALLWKFTKARNWWWIQMVASWPHQWMAGLTEALRISGEGSG